MHRPALVLSLLLSAKSGPTMAQPVPPMQCIGSPGGGEVEYLYMVSRFEVTNDQYARFLNAVAAADTHGLYNSSMGSDDHGGIVRSGAPGGYTYTVRPHFGDKPVNFVRWLDAARFVNWLENHQPTGAQGADTTEDGVYAIGPDQPMAYITATRAAGARWFLPDAQEWRKAGFYDPTHAGGWWPYATCSDTVPDRATADAEGNISNAGPNTVNYGQGSDWNGTTDGNVTTVGSAGCASPWGTFDQNGNVQEWTESGVRFGDLGGRLFGGAAFSSPKPPWPPLSPLADGQGGDEPPNGERFRSVSVGFRLGRMCIADFDNDGDVDADDITGFGAAFDQQDADCDLDDRAGVDFFDYLVFVNHFNAGC